MSGYHPLLKKPKIEIEEEEPEEENPVEENEGKDLEEQIKNEQEEALVALVEHRTKEVEHLRQRITYYKSQLADSEKRLEDTQNKLAHLREKDTVKASKNLSNGKAEVKVERSASPIKTSQGPLSASFLNEHPYDISWPIKEGEVAKFLEVKNRPLSGIRFIYRRTLELNLRMWDSFRQLLHNSGLEAFFGCKDNGYKDLMQEFYTTLWRDDRINFSLHCRLRGNDIEIYPNMLRRVFKLPKSKITSFPKNVNIKEVWMGIGGGEPWKTRGGVKSAFIRDPVHCIFHKFLAHALFGKTESNKINQHELLILWSAINGRTVDIAGFLFNKLYDCARRVGGNNLILGHVITAIANHNGYIVPEDLDRFEVVTGNEIDVNSLRAAYIISMSDATVPVRFQDRPTYRNFRGGASSSGLHREPQEEGDDDEPDVGGHYSDAPMPDVHSQKPEGTSTSDNISMGMIMSQFDRMYGRIDGIYGSMDNMNARMTVVEERVANKERNQ